MGKVTAMLFSIEKLQGFHLTLSGLEAEESSETLGYLVAIPPTEEAWAGSKKDK